MPEPHLLVTKFTVPPLHMQLLPRTPLIEWLKHNRSSPLILLSASAGFGKTTLLASWAASCGEKVAWLSLDASENDPMLFWRYFVAACQQVYPDLEHRAAPVLRQPGPLDVESLLAVLINTLADAPSSLLLILDDYHEIAAQEIHQQMTFLIEHLPATLRLILSTRTDPPFPLARFRARNMLNELRTLDLRFSEEETIVFLNQELGMMPAIQSMLEMVEQKLEGWPAGLHLLALSLKHRPDRLQWLAAWSSQHHHLASYLIEEVLLQQSAAAQEFLLCTSLFPRLTGSLCDALLERSDGADVLEALSQANLFLTALDEEHTWYRYHHLFADVLKHRLSLCQSKEQIAQLCRRACSWYVQHDQLLDAVEVAVLAEDYTQAADLLEQQGLPLAQGYPYTGFITWIEQFPPAILSQHPDLANWYATALMMLGKLGKLDAAAETAARSFEVRGDLYNLGVMLAFNAIRNYWMGNNTAFATMRERALPFLTDHATGESHTLAILNGFAALSDGQVQTAQPLFATWLRFHEQTPTFTAHTAGCMMGYADSLWLQGRLQEAAPLYQQVMERAKVLPFPSSEVQFRWGKVLLEWNQLAEAEAFLQLALRNAQHMGHSKLLSLCATQQARLSLARNEIAQAEKAVQEALHLADQHHHQDARREALTIQGRLVLLQANEEAFEQWKIQTGITSESSPAFVHEQACLLISRWLIAHQQADQVLALLPRWRENAQKSGRELFVMQCSLIQVLAHAARQEHPLALSLLDQTMHLASPGGFVRLFLDEGPAMWEMLTALSAQTNSGSPYLQTVLAAFPQTAYPAAVPAATAVPVSAPFSLEPLSPRECEILRLIAAGATNEEIASQLVIAYTTVKRHVSNILLKLDAANRTQAVARAREQGLLSSEM